MRFYTAVSYVYVLIMQVWVMLFTALHAQAKACKIFLSLTELVYSIYKYTGIGDWPWKPNRHALSHDMAGLYRWDKLRLMRQPGKSFLSTYLTIQINGCTEYW